MPNGQQENNAGLSAQEEEERCIAEEEQRKVVQKWLRIFGWILAGAAALAAIAGGPGIGAVCAFFAAVLLIGAELFRYERQKYCEAEIISSCCTEDWLKVGEHVCSPCPKEGKCPEGTQKLPMWDLPLDTPVANETQPDCSIEIRYLTQKCKFVCEHPVLVLLPTE